MPKAEKIERVAELKAGIDGSDALLLTEYRGLTVSDITELRRSLAEGGTRFAVVKNTLMQRAAADASIEDLESCSRGRPRSRSSPAIPSRRPRRSWTPRRSSPP